MECRENRPPFLSMKYNDVIDVQVVTDIETELVTLDDVKTKLNLQFDTSGSYEFNDDDTKLSALIMQCREELEQFIGLSLGLKTLKAILRNECGDIEIPFGPVISITSIKDVDGNTLTEGTDYKVLGNQFKWIASPCSCYLEIDYTAGYGSSYLLPAGLKLAWLEEIAFRYVNAGDQDQFGNTLCNSALELAARYSRKSLVA